MCYFFIHKLELLILNSLFLPNLNLYNIYLCQIRNISCQTFVFLIKYKTLQNISCQTFVFIAKYKTLQNISCQTFVSHGRYKTLSRKSQNIRNRYFGYRLFCNRKSVPDTFPRFWSMLLKKCSMKKILNSIIFNTYTYILFLYKIIMDIYSIMNYILHNIQYYSARIFQNYYIHFSMIIILTCGISKLIFTEIH